MFRDVPQPVRVSVAKRKSYELATKPHLAYSVKEASELIAQGKPISNQQVQGMYYDGVPLSDDSQFSLMDMRGVDINDAWNESMSRAKIRSKYGVKVVNGVGSADAPKGS